jgi:hypothetical protein
MFRIKQIVALVLLLCTVGLGLCSCKKSEPVPEKPESSYNGIMKTADGKYKLPDGRIYKYEHVLREGNMRMRIYSNDEHVTYRQAYNAVLGLEQEGGVELGEFFMDDWWEIEE